MDITHLRQTLHAQKNKVGLVGGSLKLAEYDEAEQNVTAHISPQGWNIEIALKKGFNPVTTKRQKAYAKAKKINDGLETLVSDVMLHEIAHWELPANSGKGCPYDIHYHDTILEAVKTALPKDKQEHAQYVANAFEDLMINPRCKEFKGDFSGTVLFWDNEGHALKQKGQKGYTPFYETFVKLNMHLFGNKPDITLLKPHYKNEKNVNEAVESVIKDLKLPQNIQNTEQLFNKDSWPAMARMFAKHIAPLLDQSPTERLSAFSGEGNGNESQSKGEQSQQSAGNGIEQKLGTREGNEEIAYGRYSSGNKKSTNITSYEQLDALYRKLARAIPVRVEAMTKEHSLNIAPLTHRPFDEEKDDPAKIKVSKLFLTDKGIEFAYQNQPLTVEAKSKVQKKSFPDFKMIVLDSSGSMKEGIDGNQGSTTFIPWGDNSKYHFALLGFYGIENFLQNQGIAQYIQHGMSLFSDSTRYKEAGFMNIDEVRKLALSPQFGNTNIDASVLKNALQGRESFVISLSDGDIANWDSEKGEFKKLAEQNHFAHIQLGGKSKFSKDLEKWGLPVFSVNSGQDLSQLMVDITKDTYKRFVQK